MLSYLWEKDTLGMWFIIIIIYYQIVFIKIQSASECLRKVSVIRLTIIIYQEMCIILIASNAGIFTS